MYFSIIIKFKIWEDHPGRPKSFKYHELLFAKELISGNNQKYNAKVPSVLSTEPGAYNNFLFGPTNQCHPWTTYDRAADQGCKAHYQLPQDRNIYAFVKT